MNFNGVKARDPGLEWRCLFATVLCFIKTYWFEQSPSGSRFKCFPESEASRGVYSWQPVPLQQAHHTGLLSQHPKRQLSPRRLTASLQWLSWFTGVGRMCTERIFYSENMNWCMQLFTLRQVKCCTGVFLGRLFPLLWLLVFVLLMGNTHAHF